MTIFLVVVDKVYDIGGDSNHSRGLVSLHRFSTKSMIAIMLIKCVMFTFVAVGFKKRIKLYNKEFKSADLSKNKFMRFFSHILVLAAVYFFSLIMAIGLSFCLSYEVQGAFIEVVRAGVNIGVIAWLMRLLTNKKGDFRAISYIY